MVRFELTRMTPIAYDDGADNDRLPRGRRVVKPLIIGQAPARGNDGKPPFAGLSGRRLARLAGVGDTGDVLPRYFELRNLISKYPGKAGTGKGDMFDVAAAKLQASLLLEELKHMKPRQVLLMGRGVAAAFHQQRREYLRPWDWVGHRFVIFPHPSGVNRWYNDPVNEGAAGSYLRDLLRG